MTETSWRTYQQVALYLLDKFRERFGLERGEGKQSVSENHSGTD